MFLYLIRHGETDYNAEHRYQGMYGESRLNEAGREQARALSSLLAPLRFDGVFCSTSHRTRETLSLALPTLSEEDVTFLDELRELDVGSLTDRLLAETMEKYPDFYAEQDEYKSDYSRFGGESHEDMFSRARHVLRILEQTNANHVAVVTHGAFLWHMIAVAAGLPVLNKKIPVDNCSVSVLELNEGKGTLRLLNVTAEGLETFGAASSAV